MLSYIRRATLLLAAPCIVILHSATARADAGACGNFDFAAGASCKIEVSGGCKAQCTPLKVEAACKGHCEATADTQCTDTCGTQCVASCDPQALDCFAGCHSECDEPTITKCQSEKPGTDCVTQAKAQCDVHCDSACKVPQNNCVEHCHACCTGSCTTQVNFDCDFSCSVEVKGGCDVQCQQPAGAIFCNGQYVHASDVEACIAYLATIDIDVSARASASCDGAGCAGSANVAVSGLPAVPSKGGCSAAPDAASGGTLAPVFLAAACAFARACRRRVRCTR